MPTKTAKLKANSTVTHSVTLSAEAEIATPDLGVARRLAVEAVLDACKLTEKVQRERTNAGVVTKLDLSPVTIADFGAQAVVSRRLWDAFPDIPLVGEEDASALREDPSLATSVLHYVQDIYPEATTPQVLADIDRGLHAGGRGMFWVLDPIDGTKGFLRREQYAVCLGLIRDGEVLVAVLGCPNLPVDPKKPDGERGCLFVAVHGQGASQHDISTGAQRPISVSGVTTTAEACFVESVESGHSDHSWQASLANTLKITSPSVRMDSQCKFGVVARGEASLYLRFSANGGTDQNIWDIAAGAKIVQEAGGRVSDISGSALNFTNGRTIGTGNLFASNGAIHAQVLEALKLSFA